MINADISISTGEATDEQIDMLKTSLRAFILQKMDDFLFETANGIGVHPKNIEIVDLEVSG